jgi:hypothetical protein
VSAPLVDVLEEQHGRITRLFEEVSDPDADRPRTLTLLLREIAAHVAAERAEVYPEVRSRGIGGDGFPDELKSDYDEIDRLLVLIERRKANSPDVPQLVTELKDAIEGHLSRCRSALYPAIAGDLSPEQERDLAEKLVNAEEMVASHPHPHLLSLGPVSNWLTKHLARFDFLRDKTVTNIPPPQRK